MKTCRLKDIVSINRLTLDDATEPDFHFRYIDISSVSGDGQVAVPETVTTFAEAPSRARRLAPRHSTIVSTVRTYLKAVAQVPEHSDPLVFSTGFAVLEAGPDIDPDYLYFLCRTERFVDEVVSRSVGVSYPAVNASDLGNIAVRLPDLSEQRRVAGHLRTELNEIAAVEEVLSRTRRLLTERVAAGLTARLVDGNLSPYSKLRRVAEVRSGITVDAGTNRGSHAVPYLRVANVKDGYLALDDVSTIAVSASEVRRFRLQAGDVLMTEGGDLDKLGRGTVWRSELPECLHQNHVFAVRPSTALSGDYLALMTRTSHARNYFERTGVKTTNLANTNSTKIGDFTFPLPERCVQDKLVAQCQSLVEEAVQAAGAVEQQLYLLAERRRVLISEAVAGKLDVGAAA